MDATAEQIPNRGTFIVFEGGDGAGKSTQVPLLAQWLTEQGIEVVVTRQPGGTAAGAKIREILLSPQTGQLTPRAEALLFIADKAQHVDEVILPALERGAWVISDRYVDSMLAYQGAGRALDVDQVRSLIDWGVSGLVPDLTVVLDVEPTLAVETKTDKDRMELAGADFHERVRAWFLELAERDPARYLVLGARSDSISGLAAAIRHRVTTLL